LTTVTAAVSAVEYPVIGTSLPSSIVVYVQWLFWPDALTESTVTFMPPATVSYVMMLLAGGGASCFSFHLPIRGFGLCAATDATSTVTANPDAYYGENVTLTAAVEQIYSRSAFAVAQRTVANVSTKKPLGQDILIVAPTLNGPVEANAYVTVLGELVRFEPAEIARKAKGYTLDLAPDVVAKYTGHPAVVATAVINTAMVDRKSVV